MKQLEGWIKKEVKGKDRFEIQKDGKTYIYKESGSSRRFFVVEGKGIPEPMAVLPEWIIQQITESQEVNNEVQKVEKNENKESKEIEILGGIFPDVLTSSLMMKWAKMSTTDRILMFQKTPIDIIEYRIVGKNPETGKAEMAPYVPGTFMFREANAAFLFDWELEVYDVSMSQTGVSVRGRLKGWFSEYGKYLSRPATGYQELNKKIDAQQAQKGATTDAIKKGLSLFGFNSDVYSEEV